MWTILQINNNIVNQQTMQYSIKMSAGSSRDNQDAINIENFKK